MADLVKVVDGQIVTTAKFNNTMKKLQSFQIRKQEMENKEKEYKQALQDAMEKAGVTHFENDAFSIAYVPAGTKTSVDSNKLKKAGLYDEYSNTTDVKAYTKITWKDADD